MSHIQVILSEVIDRLAGQHQAMQPELDQYRIRVSTYHAERGWETRTNYTVQHGVDAANAYSRECSTQPAHHQVQLYRKVTGDQYELLRSRHPELFTV